MKAFLPGTPGTKDHCGAPRRHQLIKRNHPAFSADSRCTIRITCSKLRWSSCSRKVVSTSAASHPWCCRSSSMVTSSTPHGPRTQCFLVLSLLPLWPAREESIFWQTGTSNDQKLTAARLMFPPWSRAGSQVAWHLNVFHGSPAGPYHPRCPP